MERIGNDWDGLLADEFAKEYFGKLEAFVEIQRPEPTLQLGGDKGLCRSVQPPQRDRAQGKGVKPFGVSIYNMPQGGQGIPAQWQ